MNDVPEPKEPKAPRQKKPAREKFTLTDEEEKERRRQDLVKDGAWSREVDSQYQIKQVEDKLKQQSELITSNATRLERMEEKFERLMKESSDRTEEKLKFLEDNVNETKVDLERIFGQVSLLLEIKKDNWTAKFIQLVDNKQVRALILVGGGWLASQFGPDVLKTFIDLLKPGP